MNKVLTLLALTALSACTAPKASVPESNLRSSTVRLMNGTGGIVLGKSGQAYLLTNFHVCIDAKIDGEIVGSYEDGITVRGPVVEEDVRGDLCLAKVRATKGALTLGYAPKMGQHLTTRGYPYGILGEYEGVVMGYTEFDYTYPIEHLGECPKYTHKRYGHNGRVMGCDVTNQNTVTTVYSAPGSSGSPVVDDTGALVGVVESHLHAGPKNKGNAGLVPYIFVKAILERH